jgi:hypothetical protein
MQTQKKIRMRPDPRPKRADGVRTLADIRDRCRIDELTGCWTWTGAVSGNGLGSLWYPALGRVLAISTAIYHLRHGKEKARGTVYRPVCGGKMCANPAHYKLGPHGCQVPRGIKRSALTRAKISATKLAAKASKLSAEARADIVANPDGLTYEQLAARWQISQGYCYVVRNGKPNAADRKLAPEASVFAFATHLRRAA